VARNQVHYNSDCDIHLFGASESRREESSADYCRRFEPRVAPDAATLHYGRTGADAAEVQAVSGANAARLDDDGFFLAGLSPGSKKPAVLQPPS
jgi:hypothetical protein